MSIWKIISFSLTGYSIYLKLQTLAQDKNIKSAIYETLTPEQKSLWDKTFPPQAPAQTTVYETSIASGVRG